MHQAQLAVSEVKRFYRRRKKIIILCSLLVLSLSTGAAFWLPPQYEASITILVERAETLNPMVRYNLAVALASEDRLKSFNEIIYSRSTMNVLIDKLGLTPEDISVEERQNLIARVSSNTATNLRASDSFSITYVDTDPVRAKEAVIILSNHFIKTKIRLENKRNDQTVEFFQEKLEELRTTVEQREEEMMEMLRQNIQRTPRENRSFQVELERIAEKRDETAISIRKIRDRLEMVRAVNSGNSELNALYQLNLSAMPSGAMMQTLLNSYQEYSRRYTSSYPAVQEFERKILDLTNRMITELEARLFNEQAQAQFLQRQYDELTDRIQQTSIVERQTNQTLIDFGIYRDLYNEMKVKLEQAKTTRDLGKNAEEQFIVIDPPIVPQEPAGPNHILLIGGGLGLGIFLGCIAAAVAELLDTTVRRPGDLEKFNKPVIAFISEEQN